MSGWTTTIRPPSNSTSALKYRQVWSYGFGGRRLGDYEEDHLISLELGGSARSTKNVWPETHHGWIGGHDLGSHTKDGFEHHQRSLVCVGRLSLWAARHKIATNRVTDRKRWKG